MSTDSNALLLTDQFSLLAVTNNLRHGSKKYRKARADFIVSEFDVYFGEATKLLNWQKLCTDLGVEGPPSTITQCRKALRNVWVNIWDFLSAMKHGERVTLWKSERALAEYTRREKKTYPLAKAKQSGPARALLARIS